jgi:hypothetical protein
MTTSQVRASSRLGQGRHKSGEGPGSHMGCWCEVRSSLSRVWWCDAGPVPEGGPEGVESEGTKWGGATKYAALTLLMAVLGPFAVK